MIEHINAVIKIYIFPGMNIFICNDVRIVSG